ncbi:phosphonate C-P lyase system protein PhnH [Paludibacterium paludis]|uniref:Carbon-phosphorus lyase complex subunit n=1 Tax=Paludibacterium paludis TaxID=1225769 RepID=A0A918NXE7_9NEIS|nr:phosphonate C-P lyase system protein PhnH [Paludibacterium paludis]GGY04073.1 carbon-phosphorus lyase complex subunit [Paludibacterium paludis]
MMLGPAFSDPVHDSQRIFRQALGALAEPMRVVTLCVTPSCPADLSPACAALLLTLLDQEVSLWVPPLDDGTRAWLTFHTGVRFAGQASDADFVLFAAGDDARRPDLATLKRGDSRFPDRSATVICEVNGFCPGMGPVFDGPGFEHPRRLQAQGCDEVFWTQWRNANTAFPHGIDVFFTAGDTFAGLPRSTRPSQEESSCM